MINNERIFNLSPGRKPGRGVVYWMSREQRVHDNPGLLYARALAEEYNSTLVVVFTLSDSFLGAGLRQYDFMIRGLAGVASALQGKNIPFVILKGDPLEKLSEYINNNRCSTIIVDFDPLKIKRGWQEGVVGRTKAQFYEVDGHNIVPARYVSPKLEYGAYTLRPKIKRELQRFLIDPPELKAMERSNYHGEVFLPDELLNSLPLNRDIKPVTWLLPGEKEAQKMLTNFISNKLGRYAELRNDPNNFGTSDLSPYLHFGQISSATIAMRILKEYGHDESSDAFLEELIVRKELADNFCHYNPDYDNPEGFHDWAKKTQQEHAQDEREYIYTQQQLEEGASHDPLWNAAQLEMVRRGKMHGYMRMYWAKKILEWTRSISEAMEIAIYLNDKYELDGRDPNGFAGIAWSIGGVHDRAWNERPVFGKIRYMNFNGAKRKFKVENYISYVRNL